MLYPVKKLYRPEFFQGSRHLGRPSRYFEGWYFKVVFPDAPFAVIPGVSLAADDVHGFIQVLGGFPGSSGYHRFELDEFSHGRSQFQIVLGNNRFSLDGIDIDLDDFSAHLTIEDAVRWPSSLFSPSSMGWYSFMRFMECYHGAEGPRGCSDRCPQGSGCTAGFTNSGRDDRKNRGDPELGDLR